MTAGSWNQMTANSLVPRTSSVSLQRHLVQLSTPPQTTDASFPPRFRPPRGPTQHRRTNTDRHRPPSFPAVHDTVPEDRGAMKARARSTCTQSMSDAWDVLHRSCRARELAFDRALETGPCGGGGGWAETRNEKHFLWQIRRTKAEGAA